MNLKSTLRSHYHSSKYPTLLLIIVYYLYTLFVPVANMNEFVTKFMSNTAFTQWHEIILYGLVLLFVGRYFYRLIRYQQKGQFKPLYYAALLLLILGLELYREALPEPVKLDFLALNVFYFVALVWGLLALGAMMSYFIKQELFQLPIWLSSFFKRKSKNEQTDVQEETSSVFQSDIPLNFDNLKGDELNKELIDCGIREKVYGLAEQIDNFSPQEQAYIISITGKWGVGKTTFLNGLKRALEIDWEDKEKNYIVSYSPWSVNGSGIIFADFIKKIGNTVAKENTKLRKLLHKYARMFSPVDRTGVLTVISSLFEQHKSIEEQLDEINDCIKKTEKKLVIFVDDLDRLTPREVLSVITFMRKTANLYNAFFVCAYDYDFVVDSLERQNIEDPDRYMEKIFQFVVPLHSDPVENYMALFSDVLDDVDINPDYISFTRDGYSNKWKLPQEILLFFASYRNVKRVYSEVKFAQMLVGEVTLPDKLFVLALLKIKSPFLYSKVWELMKVTDEETSILNRIISENRREDVRQVSFVYEKLGESGALGEGEDLWLKDLLKYLDTPPKDKGDKEPPIFHELSVTDLTLSNLYTYYKYDRPDDYIDGVRIIWQRGDEILEKLDECKSQENKTLFDKYLNNLLNYFREQHIVKGEEREGKFKLFYYLLQHKESIAEEYVEMLKVNKSEINDDLIKKHLTSFENNKLNYSISVLYEIVSKYKYNSGFTHPVEEQVAKDWLYDNLVYLIENEKPYEHIETAYKVSVENIIGPRVIIQKRANDKFREYVKSEPTAFVRTLINEVYLGSNMGEIEYSKFAVQLFNDQVEDFRDFIIGLPDTLPNVDLAKKYIDKFCKLHREGGPIKYIKVNEEDKARIHKNAHHKIE